MRDSLKDLLGAAWGGLGRVGLKERLGEVRGNMVFCASSLFGRAFPLHGGGALPKSLNTPWFDGCWFVGGWLWGMGAVGCLFFVEGPCQVKMQPVSASCKIYSDIRITCTNPAPLLICAQLIFGG